MRAREAHFSSSSIRVSETHPPINKKRRIYEILGRWHRDRGGTLRYERTNKPFKTLLHQKGINIPPKKK